MGDVEIMEEVLDLIINLVKLFIIVPYWLISVGVTAFFYFKLVVFIRNTFKVFFDKYFYGEDSDSIPYAVGPYIMIITAMLIGLGIVMVIVLFFNALLGQNLYTLLFIVGVILLIIKFKRGYKN